MQALRPRSLAGATLSTFFTTLTLSKAERHGSVIDCIRSSRSQFTICTSKSIGSNLSEAKRHNNQSYSRVTDKIQLSSSTLSTYHFYQLFPPDFGSAAFLSDSLILLTYSSRLSSAFCHCVCSLYINHSISDQLARAAFSPTFTFYLNRPILDCFASLHRPQEDDSFQIPSTNLQGFQPHFIPGLTLRPSSDAISIKSPAQKCAVCRADL